MTLAEYEKAKLEKKAAALDAQKKPAAELEKKPTEVLEKPNKSTDAKGSDKGGRNAWRGNRSDAHAADGSSEQSDSKENTPSPQGANATNQGQGGTREARQGPKAPNPADTPSIRVSNLSDDTNDADLLALFDGFGPVVRARVIFDQHTEKSRGFGFVNFVHKEDAERAIAEMNGYGYDHLLLHVGWAAPRSSK
ncbi:hypothetical protein MKW94_021145 [Papaver nudicaule]|uniref:RRM domain-containing protein n=1 Tax=Papaver nudicaule TaxID=74823 RepID=A0AA41VIA0_PAPNU|nr:hypothetical protein [Papaver nudicaule]